MLRMALGHILAHFFERRVLTGLCIAFVFFSSEKPASSTAVISSMGFASFSVMVLVFLQGSQIYKKPCGKTPQGKGNFMKTGAGQSIHAAHTAARHGGVGRS